MIFRRLQTWLHIRVHADNVPLWREALWLATLTGALFFLVYGSVNYYTATRAGIPSLFLPWETQLPFIPWMILPYMSIDILFVLAFFLCRDRTQLRMLAQQLSFAIFISCCLFLLTPMKFAFLKPDSSGLFGTLFHALTLDLPYNQFPSLHVSLALILLPVFLQRVVAVARPWLSAWFGLIVISTLFVYQHHLVDIAGGVLVAALAQYFFRHRIENPRPTTTRQHRRMAVRYFFTTTLLVQLALLLGTWAYLLLYPALSTLLLAGAYANAHDDILAKRSNGYPWRTWLLFAPYLLGSYLAWRYFTRQDMPWVRLQSNLIVGSHPSSTNVRELKQEGVVAVLDLAPELNVPCDWHGAHYRHLPVLDFTLPAAEQIHEALAFVEYHSRYGTVFVHCALGYLRSVSILAALLMQRGFSRTDAMCLLKRKRPKAVFPDYVQGGLARYGLKQREIGVR